MTVSAVSGTAAGSLDIVAAGSGVHAPVLLVVGEHEYPEFRPGQDALLAALAGPKRQVMVPGMDHFIAELPGLEPAPQAAHASAAEQAIEAWLAAHFTG